MAKAAKIPGIEPIGVKHVPTMSLHPKPHNPRMLFDRKPLDVLRESIRRSGILVPLTVYRDGKTGHFVILDGQRRWICAQDVGLKQVPVNQVAEPTLVENIVTMFQIHKLREDWELMPTALKVELLMKETNDRNDERLAELTGLDVAMITRCKKLLSFDKEFQDMMLDPDPNKRMKADFFIELYPVVNDREVSKFDWFRRKKFIRQMLAKYLQDPKTIKAVTDFRVIKQHITNAKRARTLREFSRRLRQFAEHRDEEMGSLEIRGASVHAQANTIVRKVNALETLISNLEVEQFYGEEALWEAVGRLVKTLEKKLQQADKRR